MSIRARKRGERRPLRGAVRVPGDKSVSHRALMLAALATGSSAIAGLNDGDDVARTATAVTALGATVTPPDATGLVQVEGWGKVAPREPSGVIDAGNSGTTARILLGILAGLDGSAVLTGDTSLCRRPMLRVVAPLRSMGAAIDGRAHGDRLPLSVRGAHLTGMEHALPVASAQVKSALLLAGLGASGVTTVTEPQRSRDHTENMLRAAGVTLTGTGNTVSIEGGQSPVATRWEVPGDISSAMFLIVAATILEGSDLSIANVGLNPLRTAALDVLRDMGADITIEARTTTSGELAGDIHVRAAGLHATRVDPTVVPALIDEIPVLAIAAAHAAGDTVFEGVGELRAKESDRMAAISGGLRALGGNVEVSGDTLTVSGGTTLSGGSIDPAGDHRIAMAFAVAGLSSTSKVRVEGWSCVQTSFPTFLDVLGEAQGKPR